MRSKKVFYNIVTNLILQIIVVIYGFIVPKIIISNFGSSVNGLISSIIQFLGYITLLEAGLGPVVKSMLYKPIANKDKNEIQNILGASERFFRKISIVFIVYIIILAAIYPMIIDNGFGYVYTISLIFIIAINTFAEYFFGITYKLFLQADQKTYVISIIQILSYIISVICIVISVSMGASIHIVKLIGGLIFVIRPILQNIYVKRKYKITLTDISKNYEIKKKWDGFAQHIAYVIHNNTDIVLLTIFSTLENVSVYAVYNMVISGINTLIRSISIGISSSFGDMIARKEEDNLRKKFDLYETIYIIFSTILYSCTIILIVQFVEVYTKNINDAMYINYTFGFVLTLSALLYNLKNPYNDLGNDAGHFKEMKKGAIIEAIFNLLISLILVPKYGLVGVAIGTVIAMTIRLISLIMHVNRKILHRSNWINIKKILLMTIEISIIFCLSLIMPSFCNNSYFNWCINAAITFIYATTIVGIFSFIFYKNEIIQLVKTINNIVIKKGNRDSEF